MSVWEPGALNLMLLSRKQIMGMGQSVAHPVLHLEAECFHLASWMDTAKAALPTLPRGSPSSREGAGMCIGKWGCWADKVSRQESLLYPVDIKTKDT